MLITKSPLYRSMKRDLRSFFFAAALLSTCFAVSSASAQIETTYVYVGNQGNFSDANGSITLYNTDSAEVTPDAIPNLNSLVQNIFLQHDRGYIMANTSNRIDVVDLGTNTRISQIINVPSPRYMAFADDQKAYVSNLFSETVTVINLDDNCPEDTIGVGQNPEDIAIVAGRAYVANHGFGAGTTLSVIDIATDNLLETIDVACDGPRTLEVDYDEELWVFCTGNTGYNDDFSEIISETNGQVVILDGATGAEMHRIMLDAQIGAASGGQDVFYDLTTREAYVIQGNNILVFDTRTNTQLDSIAIPGDEAIGAVTYDAGSDAFYLGRITGFTTAGFVSIHDRTGTETARFTTGVAPASIALLQTGVPVANEPFDGEVPAGYALHQNYPNPFNPSTAITFELPGSMHLTLKVYNTLGQEVATLVDEVVSAGTHQIQWNAGQLPSGSYLYRLETAAFSTARLLTLIQ